MAGNKRKNQSRNKEVTKLTTNLVEQTTYKTRQDISKWRMAQNAYLNAEHPISYMLQNLYDNILDDAVLTSQIENRIQATLGAHFQFLINDEVNDDLTNELQNASFVNEIVRQILLSKFFGYSVIELDWQGETLTSNLIPRQNIVYKKGWFLENYNDQNKVEYRKLKEYGTWLLEFGELKDFGLLNKAVPHVLMKRFAQSCWSELCEIYGIPPRVMKTDTHDRNALNRGKKMMQDMGSAAWFIIDTTEEFHWAQGVQTNGDVYKNLIRLCDNNISLLVSGVIQGQDTEHGSYGKDKASNEIFEKLVLSDMAMVELHMNTTVIPALIKIGVVPENTRFQFEIAENTEELWKMTVQALSHFKIDPKWVKEKFGIEVTEAKESIQPGNQNLIADSSFFV